MRARRYSWLGFVVESDVPLPAREVHAPPALRVVVSRLAAPTYEPGDEVLAVRYGSLPYRAWRCPQGFALEMGSAGTVLVDPTLTELTAHRGEAPEELFSLLISGLGLAFWLGLRGEVVIHGSATADSDGQAVLLVGPTGAGKSTLSALLCACGRQLIADDAVRLERTHRGWVVHGGVREVRLRSGATSAKRLFDGARSRESVDGRCALELQTAPPGATSLRHVAFPRITAASEPCSRLIPAATALVELLRGLRFGAWGPGEVLAKQTRALADLAREVPAYEVVLPRSERFDDERANHTHRWLVQLGMADDEAPRELCRSS